METIKNMPSTSKHNTERLNYNENSKIEFCYQRSSFRHYPENVGSDKVSLNGRLVEYVGLFFG